MSATPEFDPDLDLTQQISSYTENELKQLQKITLEVIKHWEEMIKVCGEKMNEGTRMAIDLSMAQAKKDLDVIDEHLQKVKLKGTSVTKSIPDGQVSDSSTDSESEDDTGTA